MSYTHWVEKYWVRVNGRKFIYYRYCWMTNRRIYRCHIPGSIGSTRNREKLKEIKKAMDDELTPQDIVKLIKGS